MIKSPEIPLKVTLQMSRGSDGSFRLRIDDDTSNLRVIEVELDAEAIADLVSNRQTNPLPARFSPSPNFGKTHESKTIHVPLSDNSYVLDAAFWERANTLAGAGWEVERTTYNHHKTNGKTHQVICRCWV